MFSFSRISAAVKLLRLMGWKHGQGIGPRVKRKRGQSNNTERRVVGPSLPSEFQTVSVMIEIYLTNFVLRSSP